ncbi:uncharacterized protein [Haliotis cracherodii]|uniref:uncharacterized protein n=1 Tax=Haliotis cracherodii TaxID=6455 RepID=UPI0039E9FC28
MRGCNRFLIACVVVTIILQMVTVEAKLKKKTSIFDKIKGFFKSKNLKSPMVKFSDIFNLPDDLFTNVVSIFSGSTAAESTDALQELQGMDKGDMSANSQERFQKLLRLLRDKNGSPATSVSSLMLLVPTSFLVVVSSLGRIL